MDHHSESSSRGAVEVDYDSIISKLTSLFTLVEPSQASILDTSNMIHAPNSGSANPVQQHIKLDGEVCQILSRDIENTKNSNDKIESILRQFLNFAAESNEGADMKRAGAATSARVEGETARLVTAAPILDPFTKLEWVARICQENSVAVNNLSMFLESGQQVWNLFPVAVYSSLDCMIQLTILWKLFGAYIDVQALASGKSSAVLSHDNPQVVHAKQEIAAMLQMRRDTMGSDLKSKAPVPVTVILSDVIIPVMKATNERLS